MKVAQPEPVVEEVEGEAVELEETQVWLEFLEQTGMQCILPKPYFLQLSVPHLWRLLACWMTMPFLLMEQQSMKLRTK